MNSATVVTDKHIYYVSVFDEYGLSQGMHIVLADSEEAAAATALLRSGMEHAAIGANVYRRAEDA